MKKYEKPSIDILQLSVKENIAAGPLDEGVTPESDGYYVTTYNLNDYFGPPGSSDI